MPWEVQQSPAVLVVTGLGLFVAAQSFFFFKPNAKWCILNPDQAVLVTKQTRALNILIYTDIDSNKNYLSRADDGSSKVVASPRPSYLRWVMHMHSTDRENKFRQRWLCATVMLCQCIIFKLIKRILFVVCLIKLPQLSTTAILLPSSSVNMQHTVRRAVIYLMAAGALCVTPAAQGVNHRMLHTFPFSQQIKHKPTCICYPPHYTPNHTHTTLPSEWHLACLLSQQSEAFAR